MPRAAESGHSGTAATRKGRSSAIQSLRPSAVDSQNHQYDPFGNPDEKRKVRSGYRGILQKNNEKRQNLADLRPKDLNKIVEEANELFEKVKAPSESVLDSRTLLSTSEMGAQLAQSMKVGSEFEIDSFLGMACRLMGGKLQSIDSLDDDDDEDMEFDPSAWKWDLLGFEAAKYSRRAAIADHLLGPLEVTFTKRNVSKRAVAEKKGPEVRPQQVQAQDIANNTNETTRFVEKIAKQLNKVGGENGINLFEFALDPDSFSNTVENLFHISFLIRDGMASIDTENENEEPILLGCEQAHPEDYEKGLRKRQIVMELDVKTWRGLVEAYNIKRAIIQHDNENTSHTADTWAVRTTQR
ncbi:hypothetical protein L7F22_042238 [Adiantum nelumboides]|nr:hypothetical protein [Adiantum nelumboides]